MEFDMKTPMLSRRYVPTSLKISSDMIKVGKVQHPRPFEERMKDYRGTYKCSTCNKSHFSVVSYWELTEDQDPDMIEKIIGQEFSDQKISSRYEYYNRSMKTKILNRIDQLLTTEQKTVTPKTNQSPLNK